jgi:hypothetical protein
MLQRRYGPPDVLSLRSIDRPALTDDGVLVAPRRASQRALFIVATFGRDGPVVLR